MLETISTKALNKKKLFLSWKNETNPQPKHKTLEIVFRPNIFNLKPGYWMSDISSSKLFLSSFSCHTKWIFTSEPTNITNSPKHQKLPRKVIKAFILPTNSPFTVISSQTSTSCNSTESKSRSIQSYFFSRIKSQYWGWFCFENYSKFNFFRSRWALFREGLSHKCKSNYFFLRLSTVLNAIITRSYHIQLKHVHEIFMRFMSEKRKKKNTWDSRNKKMFTLYIDTQWITFPAHSSVENVSQEFIIFRYEVASRRIYCLLTSGTWRLILVSFSKNANGNRSNFKKLNNAGKSSLLWSLNISKQIIR